MSLFNVFDIAGTSLSAQSVRLNTIASNLANAGVVSDKPEGLYRPRYPVFATVMDNAQTSMAAGVRVDGIVESAAEPRKEFAPGHPMADEDGYIYRSNINSVEEMANMISASRSYQSSIEAMNTTKQLLMRTLSLGQ